MTKLCAFCNSEMPDERPFDYCLSQECYELGYEQAEYFILGVHKSTPIICSKTDQLVTANKSYMNPK